MRIRSVFLALVLAAATVCSAAAQRVHVHGYTKKDGTVVKPYDRAAPGAGRVYTAPGVRSFVAAPRLPYSIRSTPSPRRLELRPIPAPVPYYSLPETATRRSIVTTRALGSPGSVRDSRGRIMRSAEAKQMFAWQTGHPHGWPGHVVDHVIPLACGGADAPSNMQWQTIAEGKAKDHTERAGCPNGRRP